MISPELQESMNAQAVTQAKANLYQIGIALHNYHDTYDSLPPAYLVDNNSKPAHSWRVMLLPLLGHKDLYDQYDLDQPWNSEKNKRVLEQMPDIYKNPLLSSSAKEYKTTYQVITGPDTVFDGANTTKFRDVFDGLSNTTWTVENIERPVLWTQPTDVSIEDFVAHKPFKGNKIGRIHTGRADGSVGLFPNEIPGSTLRMWATINDGQIIPD